MSKKAEWAPRTFTIPGQYRASPRQASAESAQKARTCAVAWPHRAPLPRPSPFLLISTETQGRVRARPPLRVVGIGHTGNGNKPSFPYLARAVSVQSSRNPHIHQAATGTWRSSAHAGCPRWPRGESRFAAHLTVTRWHSSHPLLEQGQRVH